MQIEPRIPQATADVSRGKICGKMWLREVLLFVGFIVLIYFCLGWLGERVGANCPDSWEARISPKLWSEEQNPHSPSVDAVKLEKAQRIFANILTAGANRELPYALIPVKKGHGPNAFAAPGGAVMITSELLDLVESEEGIAFVLAHELGHHEHRHVLSRLGRSIFIVLAASAISQQSGGEIFVSGVNFAELAYGRNQEREADLFAIGIIQILYGNSDKSLEFFEKMIAESPEHLPAFFSTHPSAEERLKSLRKLMDHTL